MFSLEGKIAVVTGAAAGIGLTTAQRLAAAGATVVVVDVTDGSEAAAAINGWHRCLDVTDEQSVADLVDEVIERHGTLDVMVNNAGTIGQGSGLIADDPAHLREMLEVNLVGALHGIKHAGRVMGPGGSIVNMASMAGVVGVLGLGQYGTTKAALIGLTKQAAVELGPRGVRVNCVCPSGVHAPEYQQPTDPGVRIQTLSNQHERRLVTRDEVAAAVHFLATDEATMINGHALALDGGLTAGLSVALTDAAVGESILSGAPADPSS